MLKKAFTLVELIVVITILAILGTIGFVSLQGYSASARDGVRISDMKNIEKSLELYYLGEGAYPSVSGNEVTYSGSTLWTQGTLDDSVTRLLGNMNPKPVDPLTQDEYIYSLTYNAQEYEIAGAFERSQNIGLLDKAHATFSVATIRGNYNGVFLGKVIGGELHIFGVPSIIGSIDSDMSLQDLISAQLFVVDGLSALPLSFGVSDGGSQQMNSFTPSVFQDALIFQGDSATLSTQSGSLAFAQDIYNYYAGSSFEDSGNIELFTQNDPNIIVSQNQLIHQVQQFLANMSFIESAISVSESGDMVQETDLISYIRRDYSSALNSDHGFFNTKYEPNRYALAALKEDGSVVAWGGGSFGGSGAPSGTGFTDIYSTMYAFAALKEDGSITVWGNASYGGIGGPSGTGFVDIYSNRGAFAALKEDGSITAWGNTGIGGAGAPSGTGFVSISSTNGAFAALHSDGNIVAWGSSGKGEDIAPNGTGFTDIFSSQYAFAALKEDGSVVTWGDSNYGAGVTLPGPYVDIYSTQYAFAAVSSDGSVTSWGNTAYGGAGVPSDNGYRKFFSNYGVFAAMKDDGSISTWGGSSLGVSGTPTDLGYVDITATQYAFAALKDDGSVISWGNNSYGGNGYPSGTGFTKIFSTLYAFAVLKDDGSIISWGNSSSGGSGAPSGTGFVDIFSNTYSFAALKEDGSIVSWGNSSYGGSEAPTETGFIVINGGVPQ